MLDGKQKYSASQSAKLKDNFWIAREFKQACAT